VRSGLGWHLVRVEAKIDAETPAFESISDVLRRDWREDRMAANQRDAIERILKDFAVVRVGAAKSL
jgi:parvulin-like peptidyl-prolyl isomerase